MPGHQADILTRDLKVAAGPILRVGDRVSLLYKLAGSKVDLDEGRWIESTFNPDLAIQVEYREEELLEGIFVGMSGMRAGGSVRYIHCASGLAYGTRGYRQVPRETDLHLEITFISVLSRNADGI